MKATPGSQLQGSIMAGICLRKEEAGLCNTEWERQWEEQSQRSPLMLQAARALPWGCVAQSSGVVQEQEVQARCGRLGWEALCRKPACVEGLFSLRRGRRLSTATPMHLGSPAPPASLLPLLLRGNRASLFCKLFQWTYVWAHVNISAASLSCQRPAHSPPFTSVLTVSQTSPWDIKVPQFTAALGQVPTEALTG